MRTKFRAWDRINEEMIENIWIALEYGWLMMSDNDALCERERPEEGQIELEQYIGVKDKNGKEIYEGDILRSEEGEVGVVIWDEKYLMYDVDEYTNTSRKTLVKSEIIGNIHENKDLLKE